VPDLIKDLKLSTVRCIGSKSLLIEYTRKKRIEKYGARQRRVCLGTIKHVEFS